MDIERLREYIVLAHRLNFTLAAHDLHMSQPTLSNHIKALETEVESTLIERVPGDIARLTPAGQKFLTMAQTVVRTYDETIDAIKAMSHTITGKIRIRTPRHEFSHPFLEYAHEFEIQHPDVDVILSPWTADDGYDDVASNRVDFAYVGQGKVIDGICSDDPFIKLVTFAEQEALVWMDKNDPLATKDILTIHDLDGRCIGIPANQKNETWIINDSTLAIEGGIEISFDEKYCDSLEDFVMNKIDSNDLFLVHHSMIELPAFEMREDRIFKSTTPPLIFRMSVAYTDNDDNPALSAFVQFLREKYAANKASEA